MKVLSSTSLFALMVIIFTMSFVPYLTQDAFAGNLWYNTSWDYRKSITIDHDQVSGSGSHTDFPVLVSITDTNLRDNAQSDGDDILFISNNNAKLSHEIESYNSSTGALVAWVKVPSLSTSGDTVLYMYYGNSGAANQQDVTNVWDSNYVAVYHLNQATGGSNAIKDSTSNANHMTDNNGPTLGATGRIGNAISFDGVNDFLSESGDASLRITGDLTVEFWANPEGSSSSPFGGVNRGIVSHGDSGELEVDNTLYSAQSSSTQTKLTMYHEYGTGNNQADASFDNFNWGTDLDWHHGVIRRDAAVSTDIELYIDGSLNSTVNYTTNPTGGTSSFLSIGTNSGISGNSANAIIDEVRISNTLSPSAVN